MGKTMGGSAAEGADNPAMLRLAPVYEMFAALALGHPVGERRRGTLKIPQPQVASAR